MQEKAIPGLHAIGEANSVQEKADFYTVFDFLAFGVKMRPFLHQILVGERGILVGERGILIGDNGAFLIWLDSRLKFITDGS